MAAAFVLFVSVLSADAGQLISASDPGVYAVTGQRDVADATTTGGSRIISKSYRLLRRTLRVCAALNTTFGLQLTLDATAGSNALPVVIGIDHPEMINHRGQKQSHDSTLTELQPGVPHFTGWTFVDPARLLPGRWSFTVSAHGVQWLRQDFEVSVDCTALIS